MDKHEGVNAAFRKSLTSTADVN